MAYMQSEKVPEKFSAAWFKMVIERMRTAVNFLDINNFPNGLSGSVIDDGTLSMSKLAMGIWELPIFCSGDAVQIADTTLVNVGGYGHWEAGIFPGGCRCYLEATLSSTDSSATATLELHGADGLLASVTSQSAGFEWKRSEAFDPLSESQTLVIKVKTSNASYPAAVLNAKLVVIL